MSWFRAATVIPSPEDQDVFDEEADETLLVRREWQGHMRKRVQVNGRGPGRAGRGTPTRYAGTPRLGQADGSLGGGVPVSAGRAPRLPGLRNSWLYIDNFKQARSFGAPAGFGAGALTD